MAKNDLTNLNSISRNRCMHQYQFGKHGIGFYKLCYCHGTTMNLNQPLGKWHWGQITQIWDTLIDPCTSHISVWNDVWVQVHERQGQSKKQYRHLWPHLTKSFPIGCVPVSGSFQAGTFVIKGYVKMIPSPSTNNATIHDQWIMHHSTQCSTPLPITAQAIWDGQAIVATDGSVKHDITTYAWIISTTNGELARTLLVVAYFHPACLTPITHPNAWRQPHCMLL